MGEGGGEKRKKKERGKGKILTKYGSSVGT